VDKLTNVVQALCFFLSLWRSLNLINGGFKKKKKSSAKVCCSCTVKSWLVLGGWELRFTNACVSYFEWESRGFPEEEVCPAWQIVSLFPTPMYLVILDSGMPCGVLAKDSVPGYLT